MVKQSQFAIPFSEEVVLKIERVCAIVATILWAIAESWYCFQSFTGSDNVRPKLATWLIFGVGSTLSSLSYFENERKKGNRPSFWNSPANWMDPWFTWSIFAVVAFSPHADQNFNKFDVACLVGSAVSVVLWKTTKSPKTGNYALQVIMTVGYAPMVMKLARAGVNTESFVLWGVNLVIAVLFAAAPIRARDTMGMIYIGRAFACVAGILAVMVYPQFLR